jgi:hypothetical protein
MPVSHNSGLLALFFGDFSPVISSMYISVHPPSPYIVRHGQHLLPHWNCPVLSVLVALQPCGCELLERSAIAEAQKQQLRQNFLQIARQIVQQLEALGYAAAVFDPRTGLPIDTAASRVDVLPEAFPASLTLDDVAVVRSCLGYSTVASHGCSLILHPQWGSSVYPSTLLSSAPPEIVTAVCQHATSPARLAVTAPDTR